jgi:hypothetical protein
MRKIVFAVGIGPGDYERMTGQAAAILEEADCIVGYPVYVELIRDRFAGKEYLTTGMRQEEARCEIALREANRGKKVALICSGDAGVYGLAGLLYELGVKYPEVEIEVAAGVTAAQSGAALLGAPLVHDFSVISLSDLLTPWDTIEKRLLLAAKADFVLVLYNPGSRRRRDCLQKACDILLRVLPRERICGIANKIGREGEWVRLCSLQELRETEVDMFCTIFIGNSETAKVRGKMVTPRGYRAERETVKQ